MSPIEDVGNLLAALVRGMVLAPDQVQVTLTSALAGESPVLSVRVAPDDVGRVVGPNGRTAKAIRMVFSAVAYAHGISLRVSIDGTIGRETPGAEL